MAVVRITDYIEGYRLRAFSPDIHRLTARHSVAGTEFVSSQILAGIGLCASDVLVDIGCGDGCLLKMAEDRVARRIGIVPTNEEKERLESILPGATILTCLAQKLTLQSWSASKIVCNGVLLCLSSEDEVKAALLEMQRIARPGATIWVGEIPEIDEYSRYGMYRGTSMIGLLWYLLKNDSVRAFLGMCRRWLLAIVGLDQIVLNSAGMYYADAPKMIALAQDCGLRLRTYFRHRDLDERGNVVESKTRFDYIFDK